MPQAIPYIASAAATAGGASAGASAFVAFVAAVAVADYQSTRAKNRARLQQENALRNRNITVRSGMTPRTIVLGTVRTSGPLMYTEFVGDYQEYLDSIVAVNAGELESVVGVYIGDEYIAASAITSNVPTSGKFAANAVDPVAFDQAFTVTAATSVTLSFAPVSGGLLYVVKVTGSGQNLVQEPITGTSVSGLVVSWSSGAVTGNVSVGYMTTDGLKPPLRVQFALGSPTQASTTWGGVVGAGGTPKWTSNHRLQGVAYVRTLKLIDHPLFLAGDTGDVGVVARGPKGVWDPRTSTTLNYTSNPALLAAWFRMLPVADGGFGIPAGWIDWSTVSAAANVCDELINVRNMAGTGYENVKRYECHTRLSLDQAPEDNLRVILDSMAGDFPFTGGFYKCFAGAFRSATVTLTDDDIAATDPITVAPLAGASVSPPNIVTGNFYPATRNWVKQPAREVVNSTYVTADGAEEPLELDLVATTDERQANYLMGVRLERSRPSLAISLTATGKAANLSLLDTVQISAQGYSAIAGKTFEVRRRTNQWNGRYPLELREIKSGTFALDADRFTAAAVAAPPNNSVLFDVAAVPVTGLTEVLSYQGDGTVISRAKLTWTLHPQANVSSIRMRWRRAGDDWIYGSPVAGTSLSGYTGVLDKNSVTVVQAQAINNTGAQGPWSGYTTAPALPVVGKTAAPSNVSGLGVTVDADKVRISYTPCADTDYEATEVRYGASWAAGTLIWRGAGSAPPLWVPPSSATYTVRAKHFNRSGKESAADATASAVFSAPTTVVVPGPYVFTAKGTATPTTCVSGIQFKTTGAIAKKATGTGGTYTDSGAWHNGTPGATYYVRFVQATLSAGTLGGVGGGWLALSSDRTVTLSATAGVVAAAAVDYQIAADGSGAAVLSTGTLSLEAEST